MEKEQVLNKAFKISIILILAIGVLLRLKYFLDFRWLWGDEIRLLENIYCRDIFSAAFGQLTRAQSAPPLFLLFSKLIMEIFRLFTPHFLQSLRIIPFITSIISIFGFYILSTKYLKNKINIITANILFCFNMHLIYFSQDFKQYSSDACMLILVLLSFFYIDFGKLSKKAAIGLGLAYAVCPWFSFTSIFVIPGVIVATISKYFNKEQLQNKDFIKKTLGLIVPFIVSFITLYIHQKYIAVTSDAYLSKFWTKGFIYYYYPISILKIFYNSILYYLWEPAFLVRILYSLIFGVGTIKILFSIHNNPQKQIIILSLISVILAASLQIYPFDGRLSLYMFPLIIIIILQPFELKEYNKTFSNIISTIFFISTLFITIKYQETFTHKIMDLKMNLKNFQQITNLKPNEYIIFNKTTDNYYTYNLYNSIYNFNTSTRKIVIPIHDMSPKYIAKLPNGKVYYLLSSSDRQHPDRTNKKKRIKYLNRILMSLKNTQILDIKQDENYNYIIKFTK